MKLEIKEGYEYKEEIKKLFVEYTNSTFSFSFVSSSNKNNKMFIIKMKNLL